MFGFLVVTSAIRIVPAGGFLVTGSTGAADGFGSKVSGGVNRLHSYNLPTRIPRCAERGVLSKEAVASHFVTEGLAR